MTDVAMRIEAVAAATDTSHEGVRTAGHGLFTAGGRTWLVREALLDGVPRDDLIIVMPEESESSLQPVWVGHLAGGPWVALRDRESLQDFLRAHPGLPAISLARLVAVVLGPHGAERVLAEPGDVDSLLAELAPRIPPPMREFRAEDVGDTLRVEFLGAILRQAQPDRLWRLSVARWRVRFNGFQLTAEREELLSDELLERYRRPSD